MSKIPKLRFKEFSGEWEEKKLGETLKIKHGKDQKKVQVEDGIYPILATGGEIGRTNTPLYDKESVLIGRKGTIDKPFYMNTPFWTVDTLFYSEIKKDMYPKFIYYKFQNINWRKYCEASGVPSLSASTIEGIKYNIPSKEEQEKIASFLSLIDGKISLQGEKVDALKGYKKGMMQKIFSRELRFKDDEGRYYPEWKTHLLGKSIILYDNLRKPVKEQERSSGKYAYYGATGIIDYINDYIFEGEYLLLGEDGANIVTRNAPLIYKTKGKFWVNNHAHIFKPTNEFDIDFMKQCLERINYVPYNTGTAQPKLNVESIKSIPFKAPTLEEQKKIAKLLINIDLKIEKEQDKLDSLNEYKKGLLQQMFI